MLTRKIKRWLKSPPESIDLPIGTKFQLNGRMVQVVEWGEETEGSCDNCILSHFDIDHLCYHMCCQNVYRYDGACIIFKEVENGKK